MSATTVKPNPQISQSLEDRVIERRQQIAQANEILQLRENPGWNRVVSDLKDSLFILEKELDDFENLSDNRIRYLLKERKDFRLLSTLVEKVEDRLPSLHNDLAQVESKIAERKRQVGTASA